MAKKIFVGNYKGGVGKTTSIYQIAIHIAKKNKKVLLIDLDPQCSLSEICIGQENSLNCLKYNECLNYIYDIYLKAKKFPNIDISFMDKENLRYSFPEFEEYNHSCKFRGCLHNKEPECAVKKALNEGKINEYRYDFYIRILEELQEGEKYKW